MVYIKAEFIRTTRRYMDEFAVNQPSPDAFSVPNTAVGVVLT
jgi:hypothetical protein